MIQIAYTDDTNPTIPELQFSVSRNADLDIPANTLTEVPFNIVNYATQNSSTYLQSDGSLIWGKTWFVRCSIYLELTGTNNSIVVELKEGQYGTPNPNAPAGTIAYRGQQFNDYKGSSACLVCTTLWDSRFQFNTKLSMRVYTSNVSKVKAFDNQGISLNSFSGHTIPITIYTPTLA